MDVRRIPYVLSIIENDGNMTKASERMHISQPALSQIIRRIEAEYGITIFDRRKTPMTLTKAGETFVRAAKAMQRMSDAMRREFDNEKRLDRGELHIGVTNFKASYVLPKVLARFRNKYPGITTVLHEASNAGLIKLIEELRTDITISNIQGGEYSSPWFTTKVFSEEEFMLAVSPDHPLASLKEIETPHILQDCVIIMSPRSEYMRKVINSYFERENFIPAKVIESSNAEFSTRMIAEGNCVSIISDWICGIENVAVKPVYVRFKGSPMRIKSTISYPKAPYASAAALAFIHDLLDEYGRVKEPPTNSPLSL